MSNCKTDVCLLIDDYEKDSLDNSDDISSLTEQLLEVDNVKGGVSLTPPSVSVSSKGDYNIGIGWLTLSFVCPDLENLSDALKEIESLYYGFTHDEFCEMHFPVNTYKTVKKTVFGSLFAFSEGRQDFCLIIPQNVCDRFITPDLLELTRVLIGYGGRLTRVDIYLDDFTRSIDLDRVLEATTSGEFVSRLRMVDTTSRFDRTKSKLAGRVVRIGSRRKQFYLRWYDKGLESKGKIDSIRLEAELKGKFARGAFNYIYNQSFSLPLVGEPVNSFSQQQFSIAVLAVLGTRFDFRDPNSNNNISRRSRSEWWSKFCEGVEKIKLVLPSLPPAIDKTIQWLTDGVSTSLAIAREYLQDNFFDFLAGLLDYGQSRLRARHFALLPRDVAVGVAPTPQPS